MNESNEHGSSEQPIAISGGPDQPALHFTAEEWEQFQKSDRGAGRSIVLLMASIFSTGLILYFLVAYICWFNVM